MGPGGVKLGGRVPPSMGGALGSIPAQDKKSNQQEVGEARYWEGRDGKSGGRQVWGGGQKEGVLKIGR